MEEIDYRKIPDWWVMCQKETCPKARECLRYQACVAVPKELTSWQCLLPQVLDDEECRYFLKMEPVRMARGLNKLFREVQHRRSRQDIREALMRHFGSNGSYYRYKNGERWLNPEQQRCVLDIAHEHGCQSEDVFDEYAETYDFTTSI